MANVATVIRDEEKLERYNKERNTRRMGRVALLGKVCELQDEMDNAAFAYNTIARKTEISDEDEKKMSALEAKFDALNEDMVLYVKAAHYRTILDEVAKEDKDGNVTYNDGIVNAVTKPYFSFRKVAARMDNKAGVMLAKLGDGKGTVSLTELQSFAGQSIGATPEWTLRAGELQKLLTAKIAIGLEVGKEISMVSSGSADSINLYREARVDSTKISNTKLTDALKEAVKAALPKNKCKSAAHIADVRYLLAAMTSSTKKLGEVRTSTGDKFNDLLISVFARIVGVTEGYSILT